MYILDGAMGTMIQRANPSESNHDLLCLTHPRLIQGIHQAYLEAGADIICTHTFNANAISLSNNVTPNMVREINMAAARMAKEVCTHFTESHPERICRVAGSIGPTNKSASVSPKVEDPGFRSVTFKMLEETYREQIESLLDGGVDMLLIETVFDTLNAKAALFAAEEVLCRRGVYGTLPVMLSATIADLSGRLLSGQSVEAFAASVSHFPLWSIGINCSFGAEMITPFVRRLSQVARCLVSIHPNAGLPDAYGRYVEQPNEMAAKLRPLVEEGLVDLVGGCCGTTPEHIAAISQMVQRCESGRRRVKPEQKPCFSGLDMLELRDPKSVTLIGERANVAGSKKFARLIREDRYEEALEVVGEMVRAGAFIIDINMDDPLIDAPKAMVKFLNLLAAEPEIARLPVMLDSSRWEVLEAGLACVQGRSIVNSISLKEGEEVFKARAAKIRQYGAAMVVMAFDEEGQATTLSRRMEICSRAYRILTQEVKISPHDIIFDPNVLTIGTGMEEHRSFAVDFIESVRYIKRNLAGALVSGGVSNLSFAFRGNNMVREVMHSVFLHHAVSAGLDMAIVNPATMIPYGEVPLALRQAAEDVVLDRDGGATGRLTELALGVEGVQEQRMAPEKEARCRESVASRLAQAVIQGDTQWLEEDIQEAMAAGYAPVAIIEELLMEGMQRVGTLFGEGKMFLPQVIKSARVMKQGVAKLQPLLLKKEGSEIGRRHKGVIATVQGDVHDIGKNIAAVVMECNNYELIDLGVMVPLELIVQKVVMHHADFVGLSGLITPSLDEMCRVAEALEAAGVKIPLLMGGATTSKEYIAICMESLYSGLILHCPDASSASNYLSRWFLAKQRELLVKEVKEEYARIRAAHDVATAIKKYATVEEARENKYLFDTPPHGLAVPTWLNVREIEMSVSELRPLVNWKALYGLWEVGGLAMLAQQKSLQHDAELLINRFETGEFGVIKGLVGFFPAHSDGKEKIALFVDENRTEVAHTFVFPRQLDRQQDGSANLCLADFIAPQSSVKDYIGLFAINASPIQVEKQIETWRTAGDTYRSLLLRSLCDRLAEAASAKLHQKVQSEWWGYGIGEGIRPAFGYPSCPDHAPKADVLRLLEAENRIGLTLTQNYMLQPVSAVCGLYFAHPQARYFRI
ncbi:MAG: methionine synthase [Prevotellaceae bacterium]|jgi:5-methyltetrahydrofolate--homocysteine methyltransferase|nr:methionine synthase [Prevotellaceae bacterium]